MIDTTKVFNKDIKTIVDEIKSHDVISIYLYGGYGRGEGSWLIKDNTIKPYNDYDIAIIVSKYLSENSLDNIKKNLKKKIDIKWIDIIQYTLSDLKLFKPTIQNYDFKYASKFLYGEKNVRSLIPVMTTNEITLKDIETLYFTRLWTLIGSFNKNGLVEMPEKEEIFFRNQMAKSVLAIVDVVLLLNKSYDFSYKRRIELLKSHSNDKILLKLSKWALDEKLFPKYRGMTSKEIKELYQDVNSLFFKYFFEGLSEYYNITINSVNAIEKKILYMPTHFFKIFFSNYILKSNTYSQRIHLVFMQGVVAYYYPDLPKGIFSKLKNDMKKLFNIEINNLEEMRIEIADLRNKL
jgi:hypothetical protein